MNQRPVPFKQLIDFAAGELAPVQRQSVDSYLAIHPEAAAVVGRYRAAREAMQGNDQYIAPLEVVNRAKQIYDASAFPQPATWRNRLQQFVATLIYDSRAEPTAAGVRGHGGSVHLAYECEAGHVDLYAEPINPGDVDGTQTVWRLIGQVAIDPMETSIEIAIFSPDAIAPVHDLTADERGSFVAEVAPGDYELRLALGEEWIVISDVHIP